jgi:hypothetical protein
MKTWKEITINFIIINLSKIKCNYIKKEHINIFPLPTIYNDEQSIMLYS